MEEQKARRRHLRDQRTRRSQRTSASIRGGCDGLPWAATERHNAATEIVVTRHTVAATPTMRTSSLNLARSRKSASTESIRPAERRTVGGDNIQVIGDFSTTSLRLNTITIDGEAGDDTIDISALSSAHRIVFKSNGGHDTIIGSLRDQDVIELPDGATMDDYASSTDDDGFTTLSNGTHSIKYKATGNGPQVGGDDDEDEDDHEQPPVDDDDDDDHQGNDDDHDDDDDEMTTIIRVAMTTMTTTTIITAVTTTTMTTITAAMAGIRTTITAARVPTCCAAMPTTTS